MKLNMKICNSAYKVVSAKLHYSCLTERPVFAAIAAGFPHKSLVKLFFFPFLQVFAKLANEWKCVIVLKTHN